MRPHPRRSDAFRGAPSQRNGCESIRSVDSIAGTVVRHYSRTDSASPFVDTKVVDQETVHELGND